ncbi:MAG: hypothetical protein BWY59_01742 [Verrucomicrobia bacterium ADurb.Bin345]|mgnify:CR=1 FL=1|nr:MAG: hypothetical protein BWY59_01742 [Verrucomicrobia bacterium ADurb.Bin345]
MKPSRRACAAALCLLVLAGCKRAPAPAQGTGQEPDYRALIERARQRKEASSRYADVERALREFQVQLGRFPTNLNEITRTGFLDALPPPPEGMAYAYDPMSGAIRFVRVSEDGQPLEPKR